MELNIYPQDEKVDPQEYKKEIMELKEFKKNAIKWMKERGYKDKNKGGF